MYFMLPCLLAVITTARSSTDNITSVNLPTPRIYGISNFDGEGPTINWLFEENSEDEPVWGYKVKLWQVGCDRKPKYTIVDGERVRLKNVMPKLRNYSTLRNLTEFTVEGKGNSHLWLEDIEHDVPYHVMVAAYGAAGEGPLSSPFRFQHRGRYTCREI